MKKQVLPPPYPDTFFWKIQEALFVILEKIYLPEVLMLLNRISKPNMRPLSKREIVLAKSVFGNSIDYSKVRWDERSYIGCRQYDFAYVGFQVINCWGALSDAHFIHEMVHIWQYQKLGAVYIPRALYAQSTPEGYDYGGIEALMEAHKAGKTLLDFNYEQQGDIVADYFRLKNGQHPLWCRHDPAYLPIFENLVKDLKIR